MYYYCLYVLGFLEKGGLVNVVTWAEETADQRPRGIIWRLLL